MPTRRSYSPEFRRDAVRQLRNGASSPRELAAELGCSVQTLQKWHRQLDVEDGPPLPEISSAPEQPAPDADALEPSGEDEQPPEPIVEPPAEVEPEPEHEPPAAQSALTIVDADEELDAPAQTGEPEPERESLEAESAPTIADVADELVEVPASAQAEPEVKRDPPAAEIAPTLVDALTRRWWIALALAVIASLAAWAYSSTVPPRYQATATVLAHPAISVTKASNYSTDLSLLSYGSLEETFVALARSSKLIDEATAGLGLGRAEGDRYHAVANVLPSSTVLEISVAGPDRQTVVPLVNALGASVSKATRTYFPIFALTPLDPAIPPSSQIEPRTRQNVLFAGLAGLVVGVGAALLSLRVAAFSRIRVDGHRWLARF